MKVLTKVEVLGYKCVRRRARVCGCVCVGVWFCRGLAEDTCWLMDSSVFRLQGKSDETTICASQISSSNVHLQQLLCARPRTERWFDLERGKDSFWISLNTSSSPSNFSNVFQMWHQSVTVSLEFWGSQGRFHLVLTWVLVIKTTCNRLLLILSTKLACKYGVGHIWRTAHSVYVVPISRSCKHFLTMKQKHRSPHNKTTTKKESSLQKASRISNKRLQQSEAAGFFPPLAKKAVIFTTFLKRVRPDLRSNFPWSNSKLKEFHRTDGKESSSDPRSEWSPLRLPSYCPDWPLWVTWAGPV